MPRKHPFRLLSDSEKDEKTEECQKVENSDETDDSCEGCKLYLSITNIFTTCL